ncbi:hypothetical protein EGW08_021411 [Elysia chlorotica]|uniref:Clathrin/coatomer adaptor adaptin-like N-terminal domain-containing protein n=1 Tax=Elysia chlorotica TaxID=188477 RepID=A0A433SNQ4_ELYCH|nr:hypothetical protein EGW08_021411 [Elysia chlorotica]
MSHIMEKTLASLPKLLTQSLVGGKSQTQGGPTPLGQEVMNFMKAVHRARSKTQESAIVSAELAVVKEKLKQTTTANRSSSVLRNAFTKVIFCHLLGYDVSSLAIESMKLCQQGQGYNKRLGYLVTSLLLKRDDEVALLMMCTLQHDLTSSNMGENWIALMTAGQLVAADHIEHILPAVVKNLTHRHDMVREKAVHCLLAFQRISPGVLQSVMPKLVPLLSSRDPGVLNAVTNACVCLSEENPSSLTGFGASFLHILHQIINRGFGSSFYYHMVPLPWLQINLLKILGNLAAVDSNLCQSLCPVLEALIERTKVTEPISLAILMESVKTATKIKSDDKLLELCSTCVGKLLSSSAVNNMRYQGLGLLIALSKVRPSFAAHHQVAVIECLNDPDDAIQSRTTHLLHAMANGANVKAICEKLFEQSGTSDSVRRQDIILMISDLAERLVVDLSLYLHLYFRIFQNGYLTGTMRANFVELILSRVENFAKTPDSSQEASIVQLAKDMLELLQNDQTTVPNFLLAVQILGCLAPMLKSQPLLGENFLELLKKQFLHSESMADDKKQSLLFSPQREEAKCGLTSGDEDELRCTCLQVISKMVLGGCLSVEAVKRWLENTDRVRLSKSFQIRCYFDELLDLVHNPQDIAMRGEIMFNPNSEFLDLSLSFLDPLIVQDMLQGKEGFVPQYKLLADRNAELAASLDTSMLSSPPSDAVQISASSSLDSSMVANKNLSGNSAKNKWRDYDDGYEEGEEQFTLVDVDEGGDSPGKTAWAEKELFAGLENLNIEKSSKHIGKNKKLWDDERQDNLDISINIGFNLHPFGLPHKSEHGHRASKWYDEDENDNLRVDDADNCDDTIDFSNLSEKCESPINNMNSNSIYSDFSDSFERSPKTQAYSHGDQGYSPASPLASVQRMSTSSTVDTLTDSDPAEESDENGMASAPGTGTLST